MHVQELASKHLVSNVSNYRLRDFLYRTLDKQLPVDELIRHRFELEKFHYAKQMDTDQVNRFIDRLPNDIARLFPMTLTDTLLARLTWDGKTFDQANRDQLLQVRRAVRWVVMHVQRLRVTDHRRAQSVWRRGADSLILVRTLRYSLARFLRRDLPQDRSHVRPISTSIGCHWQESHPSGTVRSIE